MCGTYRSEQLRQVILSSLLFAGVELKVLPGGSVCYSGSRPVGDWHAHGWFSRWLWVLVDGGIRRIRLSKRRWQEVATGRTCHSRSPLELWSLHFCVLVVFARLWAWLDSGNGAATFRDINNELGTCGNARTLQRWLHRLLPQALQWQQAIRLAVIERCEPRPFEQLFPGGVPPPDGLLRRHWRDSPTVASLWRALALLFGGAIALSAPAIALLAEARGRWEMPISTTGN